MQILMCQPEYFGIEYEINPWMKIEHKVNHDIAFSQWENLYQTILLCGASISLIKPIAGLPDMVFTANAGLLYDKHIILSHFKYNERQREVPYFQSWFIEAGFQITNPLSKQTETAYFEGAGDALLAGDLLFAGYGFRTDLAFYKQAIDIHQDKLILCELNNAYFYHLDTCFCPLHSHLALWYPPAFTIDSQKRMMDTSIELITVTEEEAKKFACNAVVIGKNVIIPSNCPNVTKQLEERGFRVYACEMTEFLKAGGACKCLTLHIASET